MTGMVLLGARLRPRGGTWIKGLAFRAVSNSRADTRAATFGRLLYLYRPYPHS